MHQTSRNLHAPFYKSSGAQNPDSIGKKASSIESKEKMSKWLFFSRPLTIESWIHSNEQSKPKPSCIKFKVSEVYEYPHSIVTIPRGMQKNYLAMLNHNIWHVTSLLHVQLKYIPLTNEMSRRYQLKFIYLQKCHFLQRPIYLAWECQAAVPSNVPTMSQITSLKSSTSLWTSLLRSLRWRFSDSIGEVELGIENQLLTHVGYCWISIWTLLMLL